MTAPLPARPAIRLTATSLVALLTALTLGVLPATAQTQELVTSIRGSSFEPDGTSTIQVNVAGPAKEDVLDADAFSITENGEPVSGITVTPLGEDDTGDVATILAIDASSSMEGELLESITAASNELVTTLTGQDIAVGLLSFATLVDVLSEPTTDTQLLLDQIQTIEVSGSTALYDAVIAGVEQLSELEDTVTSLIVLADGEDNISTASLDQAVTAATDAEIPVTVIAFETELFDPGALQPLATGTDGRFITTDDIGEFDAIFAEVAEDVASQYTIEYTSGLVDASELDIVVDVASGGVDSSVDFVVPNPRSVAAGAGGPIAPQTVDTRDAGFLGEPTTLAVALGITFVVVLLFLFMLIVPRGDRQASRTLRRGLTIAERAGSHGAPRPSNTITASSIGARAVELVGKIPRPKGYDNELQDEIDRAGWQLRASEFVLVRICVTVAAGLLAWALTGNLLFGVLAAVVGVFAPKAVLSNAKTRRQNKFMEQLPDTLQLLAGTLKAGYGVLQALDTVVKEMDEPIAGEFNRALTEARLGLPLEDALADMGERVESDDFKWVVVAINIQRQVGGNLAELLETVAETLRDREQVRRQISVLSAEGKLSAYVLIALPPVILGYLTLTNPTYLAPLITNPMGWVFAGSAGFLMIVGIFWMRKMIKIDV